MPDYRFSRPIPGQSLTAEPRNAPYERPAEIHDPEEALVLHIDRLNNPEALVALAQSVDMGLDVRTITEGILRSAVMAGVHSVDTSLLIAPVVHEFIRSNLDVMGYEYDNGFGTKEERLSNSKTVAEVTEKQRLKKIAKDLAEKKGTKPKVEQEVPEVPEEPALTEPPKEGLIKRRMA